MVAGASAGPKWEIDGSNSWLSAGFLGQAHYLSVDGAEDSHDFYLRRARIILSGQIMDGVMFFAETDNDNAGKNGQPAASTDIQDLFLDVRMAKIGDGSDLWVKAGLILLPYSFENKASAASLLGIDYNSETIKFVNTFVWRDYGVELHGNCGRLISYAAGVFDGYDDRDGNKNSEAPMRFTGHLAINPVGEAEKGWFYSQERLGKKGSYLSLGVGVDTQKKATFSVTPANTNSGSPEVRHEYDSNNWVIDMQSGVAFTPASLTLNAAYYTWDSSAFKGNTSFVEGGILCNKTLMQLTGKYAVQDPDTGKSTTDYTVGLNRFIKGHNARCGVEYRWGDSADMVLAGFQFLL